ncbi:MAG TPA: tetratricopeptide repeat protein [Fibrobacteria bacterium]|nr:tetratricopeptide repeat protein [Fibrobacteria bacterium]
MADNRPTPETASKPSLELQSLGLWYNAQESWKKNQGLILTVLVVLACAAAALGFYRWKKGDSQRTAHEQVGRALVMIANQRTDSGKALLERVVAGHSGLEAAKAAILLADAHFAAGEWDKAFSMYRSAAQDGKGFPLLEAGGRRGVAACLIEQKKYPEALTELRAIRSAFQRRNGNAEQRAKETEPQDLAPGLATVAWQEVLVLEKLSKIEDAAKVASQIQTVYPGTSEAAQARSWLALVAGK